MGIDFDSENAFLGLDAIGLSAQCEANTDRSLAHAPRPRKQNCCAHDAAATEAGVTTANIPGLRNL
jgi:hypothetical protein